MQPVVVKPGTDVALSHNVFSYYARSTIVRCLDGNHGHDRKRPLLGPPHTTPIVEVAQG